MLNKLLILTNFHAPKSFPKDVEAVYYFTLFLSFMLVVVSIIYSFNVQKNQIKIEIERNKQWKNTRQRHTPKTQYVCVTCHNNQLAQDYIAKRAEDYHQPLATPDELYALMFETDIEIFKSIYPALAVETIDERTYNLLKIKKEK